MIKSLLDKVSNIGLNFSGEDKDFGLIPLLYSKIREKELLHSDILADLLKRPDLAASFFKLIKLDNSILAEGYSIHKEYVTESRRRIDLLITIGNDKAVIIENKLNNAIDQDNQLQDYNKSLEQQGRQVIRSVYLPLYATKCVAHDFQIRERITIYPADLIRWMQESENAFANDAAINSCSLYKSLLEYINTVNKNQMNADQLLHHLSPQELEQILDLSTLVTSLDWHKNKLVKVQELIGEKAQNKSIEFSIKEKSGYIYLEIWMKKYKYWIQIYSGTKDFSLYLATNTEEEQTLQKIESLGFQYSSDWDGAHCYKNENRHKFPYLGETESLNTLADEIIDLLHQSVF